ncbi:TPA: hypothetical protein N0F65_008847, partial [Lagenidium giganteum]
PSRQALFDRDPPAALTGADRQRRWIVDRIVAHEDRSKPTPRRRRGASDAQSGADHAERFFRVRWLGYRAADDTWEPRGALLADVLDLVREYDQRAELRDRFGTRAGCVGTDQ